MIRAGLLFVLAIAAALRLIALNDLGLNSDETVYAGQAAAVAGDPVLSPLFPIFRAHPMLTQVMLSVPFAFGVSDLVPRLMAVVIGMLTIVVVYALGALLYGRLAGLVAASFMAVMPYHVIVSRQFLLDGPMTLLTTVSLLLLAIFGATGRHYWFYAAAAFLGLSVLAKETAIVFLGASYAFLALTPQIRVRLRHLAIGLGVMVAVVASFPGALILSGGGGTTTAQQYLVWQLLRRPNHDLLFYPSTALPAIGLVLILAALGSLWFFRSQAGWRERLLVAWILVPVAFFELWPTKGFQYLLPVAPAVAILAARLLVAWSPSRLPDAVDRLFRSVRLPGRAVAVLVVIVTLAIPAAASITAVPRDRLLAGSGGVPGGREAGQWIDLNLPKTARLMTIGVSMANILQFYGHREAQALSVSPNPLNRNPSYDPILNPDLSLRRGEFQYLVWDAYSAARTTNFSGRLLELAGRYSGRIVFSTTASQRPGESSPTVIEIYEVGT